MFLLIISVLPQLVYACTVCAVYMYSMYHKNVCNFVLVSFYCIQVMYMYMYIHVCLHYQNFSYIVIVYCYCIHVTHGISTQCLSTLLFP